MKNVHGRHSQSDLAGASVAPGKLGKSQEEFAEYCGLDRTYIGGIERGERNISLVNIEKLARALHISLSELFRSI
jgi:transcriptional regulator with XRE-family HTH domain